MTYRTFDINCRNRALRVLKHLNCPPWAVYDSHCCSWWLCWWAGQTTITNSPAYTCPPFTSHSTFASQFETSVVQAHGYRNIEAIWQTDGKNINKVGIIKTAGHNINPQHCYISQESPVFLRLWILKISLKETDEIVSSVWGKYFQNQWLPPTSIHVSPERREFYFSLCSHFLHCQTPTHSRWNQIKNVTIQSTQ